MVYKQYGQSKIPLATLGPGEIVGELAMLSAEARSANVEALTPTIALAVKTNGLREKISPPWILPVLQVVVERLKLVNQSITTLKNLNEFARKSFKKDYNSEYIVNELFRFTKTFLAYLRSSVPAETAVLSKSQWDKPLKETLDSQQSPLIDETLFRRAAEFCGLISQDNEIAIEQLVDLKNFLEELGKQSPCQLPLLSCLKLIEGTLASSKDP